MRDLAVLGFIALCIVAIIRRPWTGVLVLAVFSYMNPHAYAWGFVRTMPAYQILFLIAFAMGVTSKDRQPIPSDWRVTFFYLLWAYFLLTTFNAIAQTPAWEKLIFVSKIYLPFILTLWLINTREKLFWLIVTIAVSFGVVASKGGLWAILTGFNHRVWGPEGTQFFDNNQFAIAVIMNIPLLILCRREFTNKWVRLGFLGAIPLSVAAALSSWSRGALLTLGTVGLIMLWHSKRKWMVLPLVLAGGIVVSGMLPEAWFSRMHTLETYEAESSAVERFRTWKDGFRWALNHPFLGAGFEGWRHVTISDWHSSYVEIMAEHGLIAFTLWFSLLVGTLLSLTRLAIMARGHPELTWVINYATMVRTSLLAYSVGTIFLGLSYWDIFYHLVFISVLIRKFALEELAEIRAKTDRGSYMRPAKNTMKPGLQE